jgi:hypothetical protein
MPPRVWPADELVAALLVPGEPEVAGELVVVAPPDRSLDPSQVAAAARRLAALPVVIVAAPRWEPTAVLDLVDLAVDSDDELGAVTAAVGRNPSAALAAAVHLRAVARRDVLDGLVAESALFSALQAGPEHRRWRADTPVRRERVADPAPRVHTTRHGDEVQITLTRPAARNALDLAMRDELLEALAVADADPALRVVLRGEGPAFCAGGDLDEFGTAPDPPAAHLIRLRRSVGLALHRVADRTTAVVHGPCAGSGVELPAFAGRVVAHPDATFVLPELSMGLVPGAGGTVSVPARIGRHRTAWLVLTGRTIDAPTARSWGLVDEIDLI